MQFKDYYKVLGLERNASQDEIKRAYRKAARKYHPDVSREVDAEERFKDIGEAYEVLKDPEKRAAYDRFGTKWQAGQDFRPPPDWDAGCEFSGSGVADAGEFSDFFAALFGQSRRAGFRTGGDHHARIVVTLEDAYHGARRTVTLSVPELTPDGHVIARTRTLTVQIPPGVVTGQRIRLSGQGDAGGDLYLSVALASHPLFQTEQRDIHLELPITPWEAALGTSVPVPTLGGKVTLKLPAGSQSGCKLRLKGRGLPGNPPGDQYVTLKIVTPAAATPAAQALYERMAQELPLNPRAELEERLAGA